MCPKKFIKDIFSKLKKRDTSKSLEILRAITDMFNNEKEREIEGEKREKIKKR